MKGTLVKLSISVSSLQWGSGRFAAVMGSVLLASTLVFFGIDESRAATTLKVVLQSQLKILDPVTTPAYSTRNHGYLVYDTLFAKDAESKPQPQMVDSWKVSADKKTYTFALRDGLRFHDGSPVTSEDVIASLKRWGQRDQMGGRLLQATGEMAAIDAKTFEIRLKTAYGLVIDTLAKEGSPVPFIMPKRIAETPPSRALTEVIGSGPYRFVPADFQPGVKSTYLKFDGYVPRKEPASGFAGGKVAIADRIEIVSIPDPQTAVHALRNNEIDYMEDVPPDLIGQLDGVAGITVERFTKNSHTDMFTVRFNWLQPPFNNVKVRRAAMAALYQGDYLAAQFGDPKFYHTCGSVYSCNSPYASELDATQTKPANLEHARKLLKESGYDGTKVVILHPTDIKVMSAQAPITAQALRSIGMNVEIQSMDYTTMQARRNQKFPVEKGGWSICHSQWSTLDLLTPVINPNLDGRGEIGYMGWSKSDELEKLRTQFSEAADEATKMKIATAVQKLNYEQVVYLPLGEFSKFKGYNAKMKDMVEAPLPLFWGSHR